MFSMMQRLACLALLLLLVAPLVSRSLSNAAGFLDGPLCHSQPWQAGVRAAAGGDAHAAQWSAGAQVGTAKRWLSAEHDLHQADGGHVPTCEYCLLAARLLPYLLMACVLFAPSRGVLAPERLAAAPRLAARRLAHAPRGPPLFA
ncbi:hypothetical protein XVE_0084 [Xanthomonas vesicatoria ATCC 35937]|uniref:DUF2946 domain-containing protein n=1 Tax=Xanthomonas vesicatoria ATCC 35937 TaxID=925775 RepID=F0B7P0_9XANT|nr:DUF2946 family protein [Xanthomonas vesicatoria]EGD11576.1 hypothetical protein XVE_0084 [Xanthomonas vesicatoria ATCC 35937]MCC8603903.1 DUF2946 family protein [Xanthomonas vesicatoria]